MSLRVFLMEHTMKTEKWLELIEEKGRLAQWSKEQHLCQLWAHLTKIAQQVFSILAEEERSYDLAVKALKKHFHTVDIEELRGLGLEDARLQDNRTAGNRLAEPGKKSFPRVARWKGVWSKGWFFRALLPKWQRKVGASNAEVTFQELYDRARMLEKHELQYVASAAVSTPQRQQQILLIRKVIKTRRISKENINSRRPTRHPVEQPPLNKAVVLLSASVQKSSSNNKLCFSTEVLSQQQTLLPVQESLTQG